jgi:ribose-phosphate pyrophosphokinase
VLAKTRSGDRDVNVAPIDCELGHGCTPVLVDDIASTGQTLIGALARVREAQMPAPACIAVHPVFAGTAYEEVMKAGAARIVSCNTISHPSNTIDISDAVGVAVVDFIAAPTIDL